MLEVLPLVMAKIAKEGSVNVFFCHQNIFDMAKEQELSKRDAFRDRIRKRYPDLDMDNEDAYYEQMGKSADELDGYRRKSETLRNNLQKSPMLRDMVLAGQEQEDFDPLAYLAGQNGLDLQALASDPDYVKKIAEAGADFRKKQAHGKEIEEAQKANLPGSIDAIMGKAGELGLSDEQTQEVINRLFTAMDDLVMGKIDPALFELMAKGMNYQKDVDAAKSEGVRQGLETKVNDRLRKIPEQTSTPIGSQAGVREPKTAPKAKARNPFLDD